jgi:hypothetical protein
MNTTIDTFIYLKRDIEQSFQRVQNIYNSPYHNQHELNQLFNHISCTLDDLQKVNQLLHSSSTHENTHPLHLSENENDFEEDNRKLLPQKRVSVGYSKEVEEVFLTSNSNMTIPSFDEREDFIRRMRTQIDYYKTKVQSTKKDAQMEIIRLDPAPEEETEDQIISKQDEQLEDFHLSIVSLKNLTQNINLEINDHIQVLDNLETNMVNSQNRVENLTNRTKTFIRTSTDGIGGHTCLFCIAVVLFFLIIILILFF